MPSIYNAFGYTLDDNIDWPEIMKKIAATGCNGGALAGAGELGE